MTEQHIDKDIIFPPTKDQVEDLRTHNVGMAIRLASKLGRPLTDWEWEMFRKVPKSKTYTLVELPNEKFGVA